jgi:DNA-binding NarL/FixJ family response regulator
LGAALTHTIEGRSDERGGAVAAVEEQVRVLLADEQALFREAMRVVLSSQDDLQVVSEAKDGQQAVAEAVRVRPDVALLDAMLPNGDGIHAAAQIADRVPTCRVIVFSGQEDERVLLDALEAGAAGYLSKESPLVDLIEATRAVHRGEALVPPRMLGAVLQRLIQRRRERDAALRRVGGLTRREREVLGLVAEGLTNREIAQTLFVTEKTAGAHVSSILSKMRVRSRLEAATAAQRLGLL